MPAVKFDLAKADSFGGVLINGGGQVLLREPTGNYGGYVWTFAKGKPRAGELPEHAALRCVREETGYTGVIRAVIPKLFKGAMGRSAFFLMRPFDEPEKHASETQSVRWVDEAEARDLIELTTFEQGRKRDLAILDAAYALVRTDEIESVSGEEIVAAACRIVEMTSILHQRGFQKLRIMPYEYPIAYRIGVLPKVAFSIHNGAWAPEGWRWRGCTNTHGNGPRLFEWLDAGSDTAEELADKFVRRLPEAAAAGFGRDWEYAGWLSELLGLIRQTGRAPAMASESFPFQPYSAPGLPFVDYANGTAFVVGMPLPPQGDLADDRAEFSGAQSSPLADALELAQGSGYLGSPEVVSELIGRVFSATVKHITSEITYSDWQSEVSAVTSAFSDESTEYTRMPGWHSAEQLGSALPKYFGMSVDYYSGENLHCIVSESLAAVAMAIREMVADFNDDAAAQWNPDALEQLNEMHAFVAAVFLGTNALVYGEQTLLAFKWKPKHP